MTLLSPLSHASGQAATSPADTTWHESATGMWTATSGGELVGSVEYMTTWITTDPRGDVIGTYDTLTEAREALLVPARGDARTSRRPFPSRKGRR